MTWVRPPRGRRGTGSTGVGATTAGPPDERLAASPHRQRSAAGRAGHHGDLDGSGGAGDSLDLRLVPAAAAAWAGATLTVAWPGQTLVALLAAGAALGAGALVHTRTARRRPRAGAAVAGLALAVFVLVGVLAVGVALRHERASGPLAEAVAGAWTATVRGTVADDPVPLRAAWQGSTARVRYTLSVDTVEARGRARTAHGDVLVLGGGDPPALGATVVVTGRLQPAASSTDRAIATLVAPGAATTVRGPAGVDRWVGTVRASARAVVAQVPGDAGGLLLGVALGDTSRVGDDLSADFKVAGLTHLVAVSGSHFAIIGALVAAGAAACRLPRPARAAAVLLADVLLVLLVGPQPSVLRAAVMGSVALVGLLAGRPSRAPAALAATVVVLLLVDPWLAVDLGFALSVAATAAIVLLAGPWTERWAPRLGRAVAAAVAVPLAAQLACGPVLLAVRPQIGAYTLLANVLVAPAVGPATVCGVAAALLAPVWPGAALVLAHLGGAACWWIAAVARAVSAAPAATVGWAPGAVGVVALAAVSISTAALLLRTGRSAGR
ncbi:MAG: hypothetical protein BGO37_11370 [Cellulomonas sp. 73-92]|nr:MAG: hypothetical protein BGO37_11370 [Cellulomonas sp. 73-92]